MERAFASKIINGIVKVDYDYFPAAAQGESYLSLNTDHCYVQIPKTASSSIRYFLLSKNWQKGNYYKYDRLDDKEYVTVIRDPIDRWVSGIAQYLYGTTNLGSLLKEKNIAEEEIEELFDNRIFQNFLFDFVVFDRHTIPQCVFLRELPMDRIKFFEFNSTVITRLVKYLGYEIDETVQRRNVSSEEAGKNLISIKLKKILVENINFKNSIMSNYNCDYQIYKDRVLF
jgi:hypothetical protein